LNPIKKLSIVVPCFNEEDNVPRFAIELFEPIAKFVPETEFIFVDDGSSDKTVKLLSELCRPRPNTKLVQHERNKGLGAAVRTGIDASTGDAILTLDADLTFHPGEFQNLYRAYADGVDCVMGSPLLGQMERVPLIRRVLSHGVNLAYCLLLGRKITATSSLFRLYRAASVKALTLTSNGFDINAEIVIKLIQMGAVVKEVPATLLTRTGGVSKISTSREIKNHIKLLTKVFIWRLGFSK